MELFFEIKFNNCFSPNSNFRDEALSMAEQQIKNMEMKFHSALSGYQSDKEAWERNLQNVEETWRCMLIMQSLLHSLTLPQKHTYPTYD